MTAFATYSRKYKCDRNARKEGHTARRSVHARFIGINKSARGKPRGDITMFTYFCARSFHERANKKYQLPRYVLTRRKVQPTTKKIYSEAFVVSWSAKGSTREQNRRKNLPTIEKVTFDMFNWNPF